MKTQRAQDEGHRSDPNVLLFKNFLIGVNAAISFYIMPDYNHGIFKQDWCGIRQNCSVEVNEGERC